MIKTLQYFGKFSCWGYKPCTLGASKKDFFSHPSHHKKGKTRGLLPCRQRKIFPFRGSKRQYAERLLSWNEKDEVLTKISNASMREEIYDRDLWDIERKAPAFHLKKTSAQPFSLSFPLLPSALLLFAFPDTFFLYYSTVCGLANGALTSRGRSRSKT